MLVSDEVVQIDTDAAVLNSPDVLGAELMNLLERALGVPFTIVDGHCGDVRRSSFSTSVSSVVRRHAPRWRWW